MIEILAPHGTSTCGKKEEAVHRWYQTHKEKETKKVRGAVIATNKPTKHANKQTNNRENVKLTFHNHNHHVGTTRVFKQIAFITFTKPLFDTSSFFLV